jgi:hypothetical protein
MTPDQNTTRIGSHATYRVIGLRADGECVVLERGLSGSLLTERIRGSQALWPGIVEIRFEPESNVNPPCSGNHSFPTCRSEP